VLSVAVFVVGSSATTIVGSNAVPALILVAYRFAHDSAPGTPVTLIVIVADPVRPFVSSIVYGITTDHTNDVLGVKLIYPVLDITSTHHVTYIGVFGRAGAFPIMSNERIVPLSLRRGLNPVLVLIWVVYISSRATATITGFTTVLALALLFSKLVSGTVLGLVIVAVFTAVPTKVGAIWAEILSSTLDPAGKVGITNHAESWAIVGNIAGHTAPEYGVQLTTDPLIIEVGSVSWIVVPPALDTHILFAVIV
jgi:hypothetical protein